MTWDDETERAEAVIRLAALASIYRKFCAYAFDEGDYGDWQYELSELVGEYPLIHPFTLGRLAERDEHDVLDDDIQDESFTDLIRSMVYTASGEVYRTLVDQLGTNELFASLWVSPDDEMTYPIPDEAYDILNSPTGHAMAAYEWMTNGAEL